VTGGLVKRVSPAMVHAYFGRHLPGRAANQRGPRRRGRLCVRRRGRVGRRAPAVLVNLDRVIRVHEGGMRREAAALPRDPFERVTGRLHQRYGWR
jgi:hypothetical protein